MAKIEGEIIIGRPAEAVFDFVADQRNEPRYNPRMIRADKVGDGTVGSGAVFRSAARSMGRTAEMRQEQAIWASMKRYLENPETTAIAPTARMEE